MTQGRIQADTEEIGRKLDNEHATLDKEKQAIEEYLESHRDLIADWEGPPAPSRAWWPNWKAVVRYTWERGSAPQMDRMTSGGVFPSDWPPL